MKGTAQWRGLTHTSALVPHISQPPLPSSLLCCPPRSTHLIRLAVAVAKVRAETAAAASTPGSETVARVLDEGLAALLGGRAVQVRVWAGGVGWQGGAGEGL